MREIYGFLRLASRLAKPSHPSQVRTQVLLLQTCVDLQGFRKGGHTLQHYVQHNWRGYQVM